MGGSVPLVLQPLLTTYLSALEPLSSSLYGIYLYGSLALDAFEELESDIDMVVLTRQVLSEAEVVRIKLIHQALTSIDPFGKRLAPLYIPLQACGKLNSEIAPYPYASDGRFFASGYFDLNAVTWWMIKERGIRLLGPDPSTLPLSTSWRDVQQAMQYNLDGYWSEKARRRYLFLFNYWVITATATLCRILTALEENEIISKSQALARWHNRLPARWQLLIAEAQRLRQHSGSPALYGTRLKRMQETLAFIEYARVRGHQTLDLLVRS